MKDYFIRNKYHAFGWVTATIILTAPIALVLFSFMTDARFLGPELAVFNGLNIALVATVMARHMFLSHRWTKGTTAIAAVTLIAYTISQSILTEQYKSAFRVNGYVSAEIFLAVIAILIIREAEKTGSFIYRARHIL